METYTSWQGFFRCQIKRWRTIWVTQKLSEEQRLIVQAQIAHYQERLLSISIALNQQTNWSN